MTLSEIVSMPFDKAKEYLDAAFRSTNGRTLRDSEEFELRKEIKIYNHALKKCAKGHMISPELKPIISDFEKGGYNLTALPASLKKSIDRTYKDFKFVQQSAPEVYKNSEAAIFCDIYEMFSNNSFRKSMQRIRGSSLFKKNKVSSEMLKGFENWEAYITEQSSQSAEWAPLGQLTAAVTAGVQTTTASIAGVNTLLTVLSVTSIILAALIIALIVITVAYNVNIAKNISMLSDIEVAEKGADKAAQENILNSYAQINDSFPPIMKVAFFKPVGIAKGFVEKVAVSNYTTIDKALTSLEKTASKEDLDQSTEGLGMVFGVIALLLALILVIPMARELMYFLNTFRLKVSQFFAENAEWADTHIVELLDRINDPSTPKSERERLQKIVSRQKKWADGLRKTADLFYKVQNEAASETRFQMSQDDKKNWDREVREEQKDGIVVTNEEDRADDIPNSNTEPDPAGEPERKPSTLVKSNEGDGFDL